MCSNKFFFTTAVVLGLSFTSAHAQLSEAATHGKTTFDSKCGICHNADSTDKKIGPGLKGLYARGTLADGTTKVTDESVTDRIVNGKIPMPPFKDQLKPVEIQEIVEYLKTL
jgi:mono/diheme cytochrome c family protein